MGVQVLSNFTIVNGHYKRGLKKVRLGKDKLQEWRHNEALIFENVKPVEITKKLFQHHLNILKNV